ncbi:MAG: recombinase family protein [Acetobacteraceae bacterium]|nr:recombinase family protein [Acetobacteraceae bacterium]
MRTAFLPGDASRGSGTVADRPGLTRALDVVRTGDALVVWKLDRIGRSLAHVVELVGALQAKGIGLGVLTGGIDTTSATGRLVFGILATLAEFERDLVHGVDMAAYRVCLLLRMRAVLRRRDLHVAPSQRYADPREGLLEGAAWEAARPAVCRPLAPTYLLANLSPGRTCHSVQMFPFDRGLH